MHMPREKLTAYEAYRRELASQHIMAAIVQAVMRQVQRQVAAAQREAGK
jgi:hypothetical protein